MTISYQSDLPTPEAEIDKGLFSHQEDVTVVPGSPTGDEKNINLEGSKVQTVRNVSGSRAQAV
jgi:hypothetical protein